MVVQAAQGSRGNARREKEPAEERRREATARVGERGGALGTLRLLPTSCCSVCWAHRVLSFPGEHVFH